MKISTMFMIRSTYDECNNGTILDQNVINIEYIFNLIILIDKDFDWQLDFLLLREKMPENSNIDPSAYGNLTI